MPPEADAPVEALDLRESFTATALVEGDSPIQPDGTVLMHVIRPGLGRGRGRHLYEADMLEKNASKFSGWKMYVNHLSPEAKKAAGGLPRDVRDLGGRIVESYWDPSVPATDRFGQGAVVAKAKPTPFMRELIENDPEIVEASISATATGVKPGERGGQRCWIVEGIEDRGSVDWVTEAGAGGRVVSLIEAAMADDASGHLTLLASMTDEDFTEYLRNERPDIALAEAKPPPFQKKDAEDKADGGDDEVEEEVQKHMKAGKTRKQAEALAKQKINESEETEMPEITPELLQEALADDDLRASLLESLDLDGVVASQVQAVLSHNLPSLVEAAVEAERDVLRATARADADRRVQIERMRSTAHGLIEGTKLPAILKDELKDRFTISESGEPTPGLNVIDEIDDDGNVAKRAEDKLREAVDAELAKARAIVAAANPARVAGQGPSGGASDEERAKSAPKGSLTEALLQEAGFEDPDKVYDDAALQG